MEKVRVNKQELLDVLQENRDAHEALYQRALDGYKDKVRAELENYLRRVEDGEVLRISVALPKPENHLDEYDRAIRMVEMSVDDVLELREKEFASLVMNDWGWMQQFLATTSYYVQEV